MYPESYDCGLPGHLAVMQAAMMEPGVHTMNDELIPQISCNIFLAFKWILMMTSGQNISHYTTAKLSVHVWNHDLIWWQNKIDTQKHFHKSAITSSWALSKTKIPITIVKAQMPSNPNQKSRMRDNDQSGGEHAFKYNTELSHHWFGQWFFSLIRHHTFIQMVLTPWQLELPEIIWLEIIFRFCSKIPVCKKIKKI